MFALLVWGWGWPPDGLGGVSEGECRVEKGEDTVEAGGRGEDDVVCRKVAKVLMRVLERNSGSVKTAMEESLGCDGSEQLQVPSQNAHAGGHMNPPI